MQFQFFKLSEFDCPCGCGKNNISLDLVYLLDKARSLAEVPFKVNRGCSCVEHNKTIKGYSPTSSHLFGLAVDISCKNSRVRFLIIRSLLAVGFNRIGVYKNHIHADIDKSKPSSVIWHV